VEVAFAEAASVAAAPDAAASVGTAVAVPLVSAVDVAIAVAVFRFLLILCVFVHGTDSSEPAPTVGAVWPPAAMRLEMMLDAWSGETVWVLVVVTIPGWVTVTVTVNWPPLPLPEPDAVGVAVADADADSELLAGLPAAAVPLDEALMSRPVMPPEAPEASMTEDAVLLLVHCRSVPEPRKFGNAKQKVPFAQAPFGEIQVSFSQVEIAFAMHALVRLPHGELVVRVKNCAFCACAS